MPNADSPTPPPRSRWVALGGLVLLCAILIGMLSPVLDAPLFSDDQFSITQVSEMSSWTDTFRSDAFALFRPVKNIFFYAMVHSEAPLKLYHGITMAVYLLATIGVFTLACRLTGHPLWGLAVAAIWSLSASNVSVAVWASCMNISMAAAAMTFGLCAWDKWREPNGRLLFGILAFALFALALCSYESAVMVAPLAVMIDLFRGRRVLSKPSIQRYAAIAALVAAYLVTRSLHSASLLRVENPSFTTDIQGWQVMASAPYFLWTHFLMWVAPWGRLECMGSYLWDRSIPAIILPFCWILLLGLASLCIRFWKAGNLFVFGLAWFFIAMFPLCNFLPLRNTPYADYYVPIPAIGLALAAATLLRILARKIDVKSTTDAAAKRVAWVLILLIVGGRITNLTAFQGWVEAWKSPAMVMAHTVAARPHQYLAKSVLATLLIENQAYDLAGDYARRAIEDTEELALPYMILARVRHHEGNMAEAEALLRTALEKRHLTNESITDSWLLLARTIGSDPARSDEAFSYFLKVLRRQELKIHFEAVVEAADMFDRAGRLDDQVDTLKRGLEIYPDQPLLKARLKAAEEQTLEAP